MFSPPDHDKLRIHVAIATVGRPQSIDRIVSLLPDQTRPADGVVVVATCDDDVRGLISESPGETVLFAPKGLCRQRNAALDFLKGKSDVVVFIDDDFIPVPDFLEQIERLMRQDSSLVGLTGHLVADGAHTGEIHAADALARLATQSRQAGAQTERTTWLYGCNMAIRLSAAENLRFDEKLPLYGWQEDVDFSARLGRRGSMLRSADLSGIHLGTRSGRVSGRRFGYAQVANILYLRRKRTISAVHGYGLLLRNLTMNLARSLWPEADIDRRGRLIGNAMAFADVLRGSIDPGRIEQI
ncbi:MAG: glycosyltransferase [Sphingomonadales bacterium]|nr:glycosyltransferase [Sphingomonadales bacterium]